MWVGNKNSVLFAEIKLGADPDQANGMAIFARHYNSHPFYLYFTNRSALLKKRKRELNCFLDIE